MSETVMKYRSTTRKVLQLQVLGIGIILFIDCICLILVVNYDRVYNKRSHDFVAEKAICVSCDELTHNGSTSGLDILRTLNMSQDGSQCCVEQLSALLELSMTEPQTIQDPLPVFDATNFSLSSASAHRRLLPLVYGRFEGPTFINETLKLAFYPAKIKEYAEHVRNVNITREGMTITIPGHYMVYSSLHYIPESEKPCKDFSEQKWLHNVMRTRPGKLEGPEVLLSGAYTCCDECFGIHETIYTEEVEEVFAEDYDDPNKPEPVAPVQAPPVPQPQQPVPVLPVSQGVTEVMGDGPLFFETTACPNRSNPYHECVAYCKNRYGMREWDPDAEMVKRRDRMLRKYPLPEGWAEIGDYDTGRYYYWNVNTDEVSWLSPSHPKANVSRSAESMGLVGKIGDLDSGGEEAMDTSFGAFNSDSGSDTSLSDEEEEFIEKIEKRRAKPPPRGRQGQAKRDEIDPMDPAAYSDIPRGGWSEGLDQRGKAKTGVDTTASGPLFQQRPYPSPGEILRANQGLKKKK